MKKKATGLAEEKKRRENSEMYENERNESLVGQFGV
jgi:hypothetical protein